MLPEFLSLPIVAEITFGAQIFAARANSPRTLNTSTSFILRGVQNVVPHVFRRFLTRHGEGVEQAKHRLRCGAQESRVEPGNIRRPYNSGVRMNEWSRGISQRKFLT